MHKRILFLSLIICSSCYIADDVAPDQSIWEYGLPDNEGSSNQDLLYVNDLIESNRFEEISGLIILRNDKIIFENYFDRIAGPGGSIGRNSTLSKRALASNIGSSGLTLALAAIGVADDKRILSIDDPIANYLPQYSDVFTDDASKEAITIAHLLVHRGGFSWNESIQPFSPDNDLNQMKLSDDWIRYILEKPLEAPAGLRYNFNTGAGLILAKVIETASGEGYDTFLQENVLDPLTITTFEVDLDPQGNFNGGDGISISLLDWTKLGYLFINNGTWQGRRIIDPNFIAESTSIQHVVSESINIGYVWQLFGDNFTGNFGISHDEIYYTRGGLGQQMYIIPSENMIVSIFAENYFFGLINPSLNLFAEITNTFQ